MKKSHFWIAVLTTIMAVSLGSPSVLAQPPRLIGQDLDPSASGFVLPAGASRFQFQPGQVQQAGLTAPSAPGYPAGGLYAPGYGAYPGAAGYAPYAPGGVAPVGFFAGGSSCDEGGCSSGSCGDGSCGSGGCDGGCQSCRPVLSGGLLGKLRGPGGGLHNICPFCQGGGCAACHSLRNASILGAFRSLLPYSDGGRCAQRWYDLSAEAVFLGHTLSGNGGVATTQGVSGAPVLSFDDVEAGDDLEAGVRLSAAVIFGAGGNLEVTYLGGQEWNETATVTSATPTLFSFISDFGVLPAGNGFDDTDRSVSQSISSDSDFHSGELNYRRRTVGPYCRFQGSWLVGLRYVRFDNGLLYSALGENDNAVNPTLPRFFSADSETENNFFGAQVGFDLWYNWVPGLSVGVGLKGAWGQNDINTQTVIQSNSVNPLATPGQVLFSNNERDITLLGDLEFKVAYRVSKDWTFRSAYYLTAIDDVAQATIEPQNIIPLINGTGTPPASSGSTLSSLVLQGFSFGAEYTW